MQYQRNTSYCAAAALQNALRVLGRRVGQHKLANLIGVTDDGADEEDLLEALHGLGCDSVVFESNRKADADRWLKDMSYRGPILLCVDSWNHWVCVAGGCSERLWLFDPAPGPWNSYENGSWALLPKTITKRWKAARKRRKEGGLYYGILITSVPSGKSL